MDQTKEISWFVYFSGCQHWQAP